MNYETLLEAARRDPPAADFEALRLAYARSEHYAPYDHASEAQQAMHQAMGHRDLLAALDAANRLLEAYYLDIDAHMMASFACYHLGDEARSTYHGQFAVGLLKSILDSGDGLRPQTAFVVIDIREEYALLKALRLRPRGQALVNHEGHHFDVLTVENPQTGLTTKMHFNIDLPRQWLGRQLGTE